MLSGFSDHGVGVGLRPAHYDQFLEKSPSSVGWVEVISENYLDYENREIKRPVKLLEKIRCHTPVALHGVSLSLGSSFVNWHYLKRLKKLVTQIEPLWVSDHLCWTFFDVQNMHDLLPLPYTQEAVLLVVENIKRTQDFLQRQILIENVSSYVEFKHSEMHEWEFINEILELADCGLLLDVNNVYVNSINHGFDPLVYLKSLSKGRICQIHLAGHTQRNQLLIDTHDEPVCDEVWSLYKWVVKNIGLVSSMIERDGNIPSWEELFLELEILADIRKHYGQRAVAASTATTF